jgi:hypothetical protein
MRSGYTKFPRNGQKMLRVDNIQGLDAEDGVVAEDLVLAVRSCSLLKVEPQVLQRHPVMGVRAAFAVLIREGLNDKPNSPPQSRHNRFATCPLFAMLEVGRLPGPTTGENCYV